jgi:MraZ protein
MLFLGRYEYTMDNRGRVPMPTRFREAFAPGAVLAPAPPQCLRVYTTDAYERTAALILRQGAHSEHGQQLRRAFFGRTYESELDNAARLLIPAAVRQRLGFQGPITILGCGDYLELWDTEACDAAMAGAEGMYQENLAMLSDDV